MRKSFNYSDMNEIEQRFYDVWIYLLHQDKIMFYLEPQKPVGIYKPDFLYGPCAVEIDGHDYHHTKEQREKDYKKTRYLQKHGYTVVRFMGTEVFLDAEACVLELDEIACKAEGKIWERESR